MASIQFGVKRIIDIVVSAIVLVVLLPVWLLVAAIIRITSSGPVFFLQNRPGKNGKIFRIYKFRTMYVGSEQMVKGQEVQKGDARITPFGAFMRRTKVDEIPQCMNVLLGDMSLIGPRPERIESLKDYDEEISKRLNMRPGMTGLAQVSGNIYLSLAERYKYDVQYVEHFSLWLDTKILFRTFGVVLFGEERYVDRPLVSDCEM